MDKFLSDTLKKAKKMSYEEMVEAIVHIEDKCEATSVEREKAYKALLKANDGPIRIPRRDNPHTENEWECQTCGCGNTLQQRECCGKPMEPITRTYRNTHPGFTLVLCHCGEVVHCMGDTECDCGQLFNGGGQRLQSPALWEEPEGYEVRVGNLSYIDY